MPIYLFKENDLAILTYPEMEGSFDYAWKACVRIISVGREYCLVRLAKDSEIDVTCEYCGKTQRRELQNHNAISISRDFLKPLISQEKKEKKIQIIGGFKI